MNNSKPTSDEAIFSMRWKAFIPMILGIVLTTNTATGILFNQKENTERIEYNIKRTKRLIENSILYERLLDDKEDLQKELNECKDK